MPPRAGAYLPLLRAAPLRRVGRTAACSARSRLAPACAALPRSAAVIAVAASLVLGFEGVCASAALEVGAAPVSAGAVECVVAGRGRRGRGVGRRNARGVVASAVAPVSAQAATNNARQIEALPLAPVVPLVHDLAPSAKPVQKSLLVVACLMFVVGAALAAAETAITTLWPWKVRELAEKEGEKSPFAILESDLTRFLTTILVTTTSATVFSTAIATEFAGEYFGAAAVAPITAAMTVLFLFFGEILPKALAVHAPAKVARIMVPVISTLSIIVYPVGKLLAYVSTLILRLLKLPMENDGTVSEEELRLIVAGADRSGSIEKYESQIIKNVLDLEETGVREVMCPRVDMVALPATDTLRNLLDLESQSHYSRMPVFDTTIDNIIGVAYAKSLLRYLSEDPLVLEKTKVAEIIDPAFFVPESMSVWIVLEEMRKRRLHLAIVVDEYGGTAGLVTLEDILEEVVGEIYDEDDDYEAEAQFIEKSDDGVYIVDGQADLDKVGEALVMNLTEDDLHDYGTISGFLCARMGGIPALGEEIVLGKVRFRVADADDRRIISVRAEVLSEAELQSIVDTDDDELEEDVGNWRSSGTERGPLGGADGLDVDGLAPRGRRGSYPESDREARVLDDGDSGAQHQGTNGAAEGTSAFRSSKVSIFGTRSENGARASPSSSESLSDRQPPRQPPDGEPQAIDEDHLFSQ